MDKSQEAVDVSVGARANYQGIEQTFSADPQIFSSAESSAIPPPYVAENPYQQHNSPVLRDEYSQQRSTGYENIVYGRHVGQTAVATRDNHLVQRNENYTVRHGQLPDPVENGISQRSSNTEPTQQSVNSIFGKIDEIIVKWMGLCALHFTQVSVGLIFLWFGALKLFSGMSPAEGLVRETSRELFSLIGMNVSLDLVLNMLAIWEILIGLGFLLDIFKKSVVLMILLHMPSTALPFIFLPETVWTQFPAGLTLEGQYIIKNLLIIGGALTVGASTRVSTKQKLMSSAL